MSFPFSYWKNNFITKGILLWYKLNQSSGNAIDSSKNNNIGVLRGSAESSSGFNGYNCILFPNNTGGGSDIDVISCNTISYNGDWSITCWVNLLSLGIESYVSCTNDGTGVFVGGSATSNQWGFYDGSTLLLGSTLTIGTWYFITVTKSGGTFYTIYLNSISQNSGTLSNINISVLFVGCRDSALGLHGSVYDFRIYNRVLSSTEITRIYNLNG